MKRVKKFMIEYIKGIPKTVWEKKKKNGMNLELTRFDDTTISKYIIDNNLVDVQTAMKFIVDFNIEMINATTDEFIEIKNELHDDRINLLKCAGDHMKIAIDNPDNCANDIDKVQNYLISSINALNTEIERNLQIIKTVEGLEEKTYWFQSIINLKKCDRAIVVLKENSEAMCKAYELYYIMIEYTEKDLSSIKEKIKGFGENMLRDDTTFLLASYCKDAEQKEYFHKLEEKITSLDNMSTPVNKIIEEYWEQKENRRKREEKQQNFWNEDEEEEYCFEIT